MTRYEERLLSFGCPMTKSFIRYPFPAPTYYAYTQKQLSYSWKNYMKKFVAVTRGANLCLTGPLHKAIGGQICKRKHKTM